MELTTQELQRKLAEDLESMMRANPNLQKEIFQYHSYIQNGLIIILVQGEKKFTSKPTELANI